MKINVKKEDLDKYNIIELGIKQSKEPITIKGSILDFKSTLNEFYVHTDKETFQIKSDNIIYVHLKIDSIITKADEVGKYLDL